MTEFLTIFAEVAGVVAGLILVAVFAEWWRFSK